MTKVENLRKILHTHKEELNRKYNVTAIGILGSYVKNEQNDTSDIDILVEFDKAIDLFTLSI